MANMSYCRFQNTAQDLDDCLDNINDTSMSKEEYRARQRLIRIAQQIVECADSELTLDNEQE
jgi:hypothetical protein